MNETSWIKRHALIAFFVLAYAVTWVMLPLLVINPLLGLFGLFGPAIAAIIVTALTEGRAGVGALLGRLGLWRVSPIWHAFALILPIVASLAAAFLTVAFGAPNEIAFNPIGVINIVLFFLVAGEEIGWRGFALPRLLKSYPPLIANLILGVAWTFWHTPTFFLPGLPQNNIPIPAYFLFVMGLTFIFTFLFQRTKGSLLLATMLHGAVNVLGFNNGAGQNWWANAAVYIAIAIILVVIDGPSKQVKNPEGLDGGSQSL